MDNLNEEMLDCMIENILGLTPRIHGVVETWKHVESFEDPYTRVFFRCYFFEALKKLHLRFEDYHI